MERNVTIIIPVYSDWSTLGRCIESLKKCLPGNHKVLLLNDCGPEADALEKKIKLAIKGQNNFEYHRNPKNLGFVKTCNRAAFELDKSGNDIMLLNSDTAVTNGFLAEMQKVLYAHKNHGAVSPRSNSASMATIPIKPCDGAEPTPERAYKVYQKIHEQLSDYTAAVDAHGYCMLVKRGIIDQYGLFDEVYSPGYAEETDFSMRIRRRGHKCLFANHAFVFHYRAETFTSERKARLKARNKKILYERYPEVEELVREYFKEINPIDWFADLIAREHGPLKLMIDLSHLPQVEDKISDSVRTLLEKASSYKKAGITVVANSDVIEYFNLREHKLRLVLTPELNELFHVGYCPFPVTYPNDLLTLNQWSLQIGFHGDIVSEALKNRLNQDSVAKQVFEDSSSLADFNLHDVKENDVLDMLVAEAQSPLDINKLEHRWKHISRSSTYNQKNNMAQGKLTKRVRTAKSRLRNFVKEKH